MDLKVIRPFVKGKARKAMEDMDKFINYWVKARAEAPPSIKLEEEFYDAIAKKLNEHCLKNHIRRDGVMTYRDIKIEKIRGGA